jgi:hypothetical protein
MRTPFDKSHSTNKDDYALQQIILQHLFEKLARQHDYVINLRNQAGISAAVAGLIATFFGTIIGEQDSSVSGSFFLGLSAFAAVAILLFAMSIGCSVAVVVHHSEFTNSFDTRIMLKYNNKGEKAFYRDYINDGEWFHDDNERLIGLAQTKLWFAMVFAFAQIIPWTIVLSGAINVGK